MVVRARSSSGRSLTWTKGCFDSSWSCRSRHDYPASPPDLPVTHWTLIGPSNVHAEPLQPFSYAPRFAPTCGLHTSRTPSLHGPVKMPCCVSQARRRTRPASCTSECTPRGDTPSPAGMALPQASLPLRTSMQPPRFTFVELVVLRDDRRPRCAGALREHARLAQPALTTADHSLTRHPSSPSTSVLK